jgi:hypothetical protein
MLAGILRWRAPGGRRHDGDPDVSGGERRRPVQSHGDEGEHQDRQDARADQGGGGGGEQDPVSLADLGQGDQQGQRGRRDEGHFHPLAGRERMPVHQQRGQAADDQQQTIATHPQRVRPCSKRSCIRKVP